MSGDDWQRPDEKTEPNLKLPSIDATDAEIFFDLLIVNMSQLAEDLETMPIELEVNASFVAAAQKLSSALLKKARLA
jgi:hypothetical protein